MNFVVFITETMTRSHRLSDLTPLAHTHRQPKLYSSPFKRPVINRPLRCKEIPEFMAP